MSTSLEAAILVVYPGFNTPADQIVTDPIISQQFAALVNAQLPSAEKASVSEINKRLLYLRRRGEANGGLPRLRRQYHGRNGQTITV